MSGTLSRLATKLSPGEEAARVVDDAFLKASVRPHPKLAAIERNDVVPGDTETISYNPGTLYGEWPDGHPIEGNRYVDCFVVRGDVIVTQEVWNDSAERILLHPAAD